MTSAPPVVDAVQYQARFPQALTDDAGRRFTEYVYRHLLGWKIGLAVAINIAGCAMAVFFSGWMTSTIALSAFTGTAIVYFLVNRVVRPGVTSRRLQVAFGAGATVTLRPDGFDIAVGERRISRPWSRQRAILEFDAYWLLPILPTMCLVLPRDGMPAEGEAWVREAMRGEVTASVPPGP